MKKEISKDDLLPLEAFAKIRDQKRKEIIKIKENRHVVLGPEASLYFENFDTLWWQIQEMLFIEKGGEPQIQDELLAYNPLVPQGQELVATFMIEIADPTRRTKVLGTLGGIEHCLFLRFAGHTLKAIPENDPNRTTESGKTSSIHFVRWALTPPQIADFSRPGQDIILEVTHPQFSYKALLTEAAQTALAKDFS